MTGRPEATIGGSDVAAILGVAPPGWRTARDVWWRLLGNPAPEDDAPHLEFGRRLERAVLDWYLDRCGVPRRSARRGIVLRGDAVGAPECHGTIDALIRRRGGQCWLAEVKTTGVGWQGVPPHYLAQALHYLALCPAASRVDFAVLDVRARQLLVEPVERAPHADLIAEQLAYVRAWWQRHVEPALDPTLTPEERERYAPPGPAGTAPVILPHGAVVADTADTDVIAAYREAQRAVAEAEERLAAAREAVLERLRQRGADTLVDARGQRLAWCTSVTAHRLDQRRLAAEHPELVERYRRESVSTRLHVRREHNEET